MFTKTLRPLASVLVASGLAFHLTACDDSTTSTTTSSSSAVSSSSMSTSSSSVSTAKNIVEIVAGDTAFSTLKTAVLAAKLDGALSDPSKQYTVFAPTNAAFAALGPALDALLKDPEGQLKDILLHHVVQGKVPASEVVKLSSANTLFGGNVDIKVVDGGVLIDGKIKVVATDVQATNGIVHVIDAVVLPSIADVVTAKPDFSTLKAALGAAKLDAVLAGPGTFTVLAPTNAAFDKLPAGTVDNLLKDPSGALTDILKYHVVGSVAYAKDVVTLTSIPTLLTGATISVSTTNGVLLNNSSKVTATDIYANNGVIHVIDGVLLPPAK